MENKYNYYLQIADNALVLSHRLSENCSRGPFLEEDLANTNVALDLIGMAESIYEEIAKNGSSSSDDIAYKRDENSYKNTLLVEQENGDFANLMTRQFFCDVFHLHFFTLLHESKDAFLQALAVKSLKEVKYHVKRSSEWMIRFGLGTDVSKKKVENAIGNLWEYTFDLFVETDLDKEMKNSGVGVDLKVVNDLWLKQIQEVFYHAELTYPQDSNQQTGGKSGVHSEKMGYLLCEMQFLTNKYPEATW
jgi:ring-1,2-phenylacetyl-CoA epoxidase subunit PaaC